MINSELEVLLLTESYFQMLTVVVYQVFQHTYPFDNNLANAVLNGSRQGFTTTNNSS